MYCHQLYCSVFCFSFSYLYPFVISFHCSLPSLQYLAPWSRGERYTFQRLREHGVQPSNQFYCVCSLRLYTWIFYSAPVTASLTKRWKRTTFGMLGAFSAPLSFHSCDCYRTSSKNNTHQNPRIRRSHTYQAETVVRGWKDETFWNAVVSIAPSSEIRQSCPGENIYTPCPKRKTKLIWQSYCHEFSLPFWTRCIYVFARTWLSYFALWCNWNCCIPKWAQFWGHSVEWKY